MVRIKAMLKKVMFILVGSIILASCQNNMETQEAYLTFSEVASRAATQVNPNYTIYDFEQFTLTGSNYNFYNLELGTWDNYDSLLKASVSIPELGDWDFTLEATNKGTVFSSTISKNISYGANSVFFELSPEEYGKEGNGSVRIGFKLQNIPYVKNGNNIQIDYDVTFKVVNMLENLEFEAEKPATLVYGKSNNISQQVDVFALWETESIPAGDYFVYFYVNKGDIKHIVKKVLSVTVSPDVLTTNEDKYNSETSDEYFTITETVISDNMDVTKCSISYNLNGGSFDSMQIIPGSYNILSSTDTVLPTPTKADYNFGGWYTTSTFDEGTEISFIPAGSSADVNVYAKWDIPIYNITYELNGGTISESYATTYTIKDSITLPTPTKAGYNFGGWYTSQDFDYDTKISKINSGSTGDLTLYAKWNSPIPWTVSSTDTYYFEQSGDTWISNNQAANGSSATTTWTITLPESVNVSIPWSVSSESGCDKLTVTLDSKTIVNAVSGDKSRTIETTLSAGTHTLTATYSKDSSQANGSDCATITLYQIVY